MVTAMALLGMAVVIVVATRIVVMRLMCCDIDDSGSENRS